MTKVTIIGETPKAKNKLKPITFYKGWRGEDLLTSCESGPEKWANIELIAKKYLSGYDLMFAYDTDRSNGIVYIGHFNDGVVE